MSKCSQLVNVMHTYQPITGGVLADVYSIAFLVNSGPHDLTLVNGQIGQLKFFTVVSVEADPAPPYGAGVTTLTTPGENYATIIFTNIGDRAILKWTGTGWRLLYSYGAVVTH